MQSRAGGACWADPREGRRRRLPVRPPVRPVTSACTGLGGQDEHPGDPGGTDRGSAIADGRRYLRRRPAGAGTARGGAGHVRAQSRRACADHRPGSLGGPGRAGRARRVHRPGHGRPAPAAPGRRDRQRGRARAARRPVGRAAAGPRPGAVRRRAGGGRADGRHLSGRGCGRTGQRGLRAAAGGGGLRRRAGPAGAAVPRDGLERGGELRPACRPVRSRRLRRGDQLHDREPAPRTGPARGPRRRCPVVRRPAHRVAEHPERAGRSSRTPGPTPG